MSTRSHRQGTFVAGAAAIAACLLVCGCGSQTTGNGIASLSPDRALARVQAAAADAATVHLAGDLAGPGRPLAIDMELERGQGGQGTISVGGLRAQLVQDAGWLYVKANPAFLRRLVGGAAATALAGRWLKGPADHGPFAPLASLTDLRTVLHETLSLRPGQSTTRVGTAGGHAALLEILSSHDALSVGRAGPVAGRPAVALRDRTTGATLYASATGNPYPLVLRKTRSGSGTMRFDRWNQAVSLEAPLNPLNIKSVFRLKRLKGRNKPQGPR